MIDSRFFSCRDGVSLEEIAEITGATISHNSKETHSSINKSLFSGVAPLEIAEKNDISFLDNTKYLSSLKNSKAGACFIREKFANRAPCEMILLITEEPYYAYAIIAQKFYPQEKFVAEISPRANISSSASIGKNVRIEVGATIGDNVKIADNCIVGANTILDKSVEIGENTKIGGLCSISHTLIGKNVIIHRGVHIGQDGFGFAAGKKGITKVPQLGRVIIEDNVEIGSGTCIDRGAGHDTKIGFSSKIDNLVQIGHNVQIGSFTMIAAQTGIAGSTKIGNAVLIGGQVGFSGHNVIGNSVKIAAQSGVMTDIPDGATYGGSPAVPIMEWHRQNATIAKISRKKSKIALDDE